MKNIYISLRQIFSIWNGSRGVTEDKGTKYRSVAFNQEGSTKLQPQNLREHASPQDNAEW